MLRRVSSKVACPLAASGYDQSWREFLECLSIHVTLEFDHLTDRVPVAHPAPIIELRLSRPRHTNTVVAGDHLQQKPLLLLAFEVRRRVVAPQPLRQPVAQPAGGAREDLHAMLFEPDFLVELTKQ